MSHLKKCNTSIVNITSSTAVHPLPHMSVYAASKSFLRSWSLAIAEELKQTNSVLTFAPSGTDTSFQDKAGVKKVERHSLLSPGYVAEQILLAIDSNKLNKEIGFYSVLLNRISIFLPLKLRLKLWSFLFQSKR